MRWLTKKEEQRLWEEKDKHKITCKCGHVNIIMNNKGYQICSWCNHYVFANSQIEFNHRLKENLIKEKRKENER